jgi:hypothetical protein
MVCMSSTGATASVLASTTREQTYLPNFVDQGVIGMDVLEQLARIVIDFRAKEIDLCPSLRKSVRLTEEQSRALLAQIREKT